MVCNQKSLGYKLGELMGLFFQKREYAIVDRNTGLPIMYGFKSKKEAQRRIAPSDTDLIILPMKKGWKKKHALEKLM